MAELKCRVENCTSCKLGEAHYCIICDKKDVDHRATNCPSKVASLVEALS